MSGGLRAGVSLTIRPISAAEHLAYLVSGRSFAWKNDHKIGWKTR